MQCPTWSYFPRNTRPPKWTADLVEMITSRRDEIDTEPVLAVDAERLTSDHVLGRLRSGMQNLGYTVEAGKKKEQKIVRPVLYGENGRASVNYEVDAFHDELGIAVEVEAGRGTMSNADHRDILRTSLLLDARFLVLMMPKFYRYGVNSSSSGYANAYGLLDAIYASQRLRLPFEGVLLIGY